MRKFIKFNMVTIFFILFFVVINIKGVYASNQDDYESYISYYNDSDEIYDMSDRDNINSLNYSISNYGPFLYASNLEYLNDEQKIKVNGTDPISNIIPIEYFYEETENVFIGKEYVSFIHTEEIKESNKVVAYKSHVAVIDINDNINNNQITNSYIELSVNRLFEYNYVTILKSKNYILPYWELNMSILNKMIISNDISDDYLIIPLVNISYATIEKKQVPAVKVSNINMLSTFINSNDYNEYDNNYNMMSDDGYFFTGMAVDYYATQIVVGSNNKCKLFFKTVSDILGILPIGNEIASGIQTFSNNTITSYGIVSDVLGLFSYAPVVYTPVSSDNAYVSKTELLYTDKDDQIKNYGHLMKNYFAEYTGPALLNKNDHVNTKFQYSYKDKFKSTRINEVISFEISYGNSKYEILYENTKDINTKETKIELDTILKNEFNEYYCESIYNYISQTTQELEVYCGNNNVMIYEDNILVSTNKRYSFVKNKSYKIVVINKCDDKKGILYDFYLKGYSINDILNLDSNESALYTFESSEDIIRYVDTNGDLNQLELIYFKENEIYQFIVTNSDKKKDIYLKIKDIEEANLDEDGYILNDAKFVKISNNSWFKIEKKNSGACSYSFGENGMLTNYSDDFISNSELVVYLRTSLIYKVISVVDSVEIKYNDMSVEKNIQNLGVIYTLNDTIAFDCYSSLGDMSIIFRIDTVRYNGNYSTYDGNVFEATNGYGRYELTVVLIIYNNNLLLNEIYHIDVIYYALECNVSITERIYGLDSYGFKLSTNIFGDNIYVNIISQDKNVKIDYEGEGVYYIHKNWDSSCSLLDKIYLDIYIKIFESQEYVNVLLDNPNCNFVKNSKTRICVVASPLKIEDINNYSRTFLISNLDELKFALTYSEYGYISYDDGINYDVEIYGYINSYNFRIINDIDCQNQTIEINKGILFGGVFNGGGNTISNLIIKIIKNDDFSNSRYRGVFESNYGVIENIKFYSVIYDLTEYKDDKDKIFGFITPGNYGIINDETIEYEECYYRYLYYSKPLIGKGKWVTKTKKVTITNQYEF